MNVSGLLRCAIVGVMLGGGAVLPVGASPLTLRQDPATRAISVFRDGASTPILTQNAPDHFRPYLHPLVAPDGNGVLTEFSPDHHKHQTGLYWGFTRVNGRDYFHNPGNGYWRRIACEPQVATGAAVKWSTVYHLLDADGRAIMTETQTWTMRAEGARYLIDLEWQGQGLVDLTIGKYDYGGLFLRMPWREGMEGAAHNSALLANERATGGEAQWVDVGMKIAGRSDQAHIAILDHPRNTGHPLRWRVDKMMGIGPSRAITGDWRIPQGQTETVRHRFIVYTGGFDAPAVSAAWKVYAGAGR